MNAISKIKNTLVTVVLSTVFFSCEYNVEEQDDIVEVEQCDSNISFVTNVKPIIDTNCIRCHGGSQAPDLRTFAGVNSNAQRIKTQVVTRRMPRGDSLTNEEIELIRCWIENGALNN